MGMFDTVKYKAPCWKCKHVLTDFQSKDGECMLDIVTPKQLGAGRFYTDCPKCHSWNEYRIIPKTVEIVLDTVESKLQS